MKIKVNKMVSALGKVFVEGREYDSNEFPAQFLDEWLKTDAVEKVKKEKPAKEKKE